MGSLAKNTIIEPGTSIESIIKTMTNGTFNDIIFDSIYDVDEFFNFYNHNNNYSYGNYSLQIGGTITINDGTYNKKWYIVGFDVEKSRVASDDTTYDNGYGIALVPFGFGLLDKDTPWNTLQTTDGGYYSSTIRNTTLSQVAINLQNVLGDHLINRNVLLSNSVDSGYYSNSYIWTKDYATLPSGAQITGNLASYSNKYDDGEANYQLPYYINKDYGSYLWLRGVCGKSDRPQAYRTIIGASGGTPISYTNPNVSNDMDILPMIYIR